MKKANESTSPLEDVHIRPSALFMRFVVLIEREAENEIHLN